MSALSKPNEIARETLRLLVTRKEAPTPDNYGRLYCEISGDASAASASVEKMLQRLAQELPRNTPELVRLTNALASANENRNWHEGYRALLDFAKQRGDAVSAAEWTTLLRELVRLACDQALVKPCAERRAALEKILAASADAPVQVLYRRLVDLTHAWARSASVITSDTREVAQAANDGFARDGSDARELRELLAFTLETAIGARLVDEPGLAASARALAERLRNSDPLDGRQLRADLQALWHAVEQRVNARNGVQEGLLQVLRLLVENVGELVADDQWLRGQISIVQQVISGPLDLAAVEEAQRNLKNAILHQSMLKQSLNATKTTIKQMLASFIDELGKLSTATGDYHDSIENLAQQIRQTEDVTQLDVLLEEVLRETRSVQASALHSREEVLRAREQVSVAELKIRELEVQLEEVSDKAVRDHLTGTLNRRGLNEALEREIAIADRQAQPLSVALLDIDNFKDLNDTLGHQVGDDALVHLAKVIKETLRPSDSVARFGGEEFLILMPNSDTEQGTAVISRLQRELTKRFFLHDNRKLLMTFSAGISTYARGETQTDVIARADRALYQAKRAGKNRVIAA
jgi:diguanylate cyclase